MTVTADTTVSERPADQATPGHSGYLARVVVGGEALTRLSALQEADRAQAVTDLEAENRFVPTGLTGPFVLHLAIQEGRLAFDIRDQADAPLTAIILALGPFRGLIKDYQLLIECYETAMAEGREAKVQAVDMGRRGLHNEGATLLQERLENKVAMDFETARRLFTLVCALHQRI